MVQWSTNKWPGWSEERTLVLPIPPEVWAPPLAPIELDGREFAPKDELHLTVVGRELGRQVHETLGERFRDTAVRAAFEAQPWRMSRTGECLRIGKQVPSNLTGRTHEVGSIIELVTLPAMARFYRALGDLLGRKLPVPPPHVTLYVHGSEEGIGIPTKAKLRAWTRRSVRPDELAAAEPMVS